MSLKTAGLAAALLMGAAAALYGQDIPCEVQSPC